MTKLEKHRAETAHFPASLQVELVACISRALETDAFVSQVKHSVVVLEKVEAKSQEVLVTCVSHNLECAYSTIVTNIARWRDRVDNLTYFE